MTSSAPSVDLQDLIKQAERFVQVTFNRYAAQKLPGFSSAHDWSHIQRVRRMARFLAKEEGANPELVDLVALLHDIEDRKFSGSDAAGPLAIETWLASQGAPDDLVAVVIEIVRGISFKGDAVPDVDLTREGQCVRDADRLDALGALGIARAFVHGGHLGQTIHDPEVPPIQGKTAEQYKATDNTSLNHFYEKTLLLARRMSTSAGQRIAKGRHEYTEQFLERFKAEWEAENLEDVRHSDGEEPSA